ncbi:RES family NAD+ phosphorylase [Runella slithyformis]|uniref:RES domain protein n=1 Tax=Runella slithyformis (strain ATCC 29530 / DSM 19594 / LMG 11500 / NCIMB 11436 / LSU 4) TaxID=761193 RepID=A0A7U4E8I7_RUNSL|nr:RES family NAD+ phosphorylase [Runella slithyformis]AEI51746.1 RES domain protein [Runella slithyformis DSM 19594]
MKCKTKDARKWTVRRGRNSADRMVIYTVSSRALACLENVVHRSGRGLQEAFRTIVIDIPDTLSITEISFESLPAHWTEFTHYTDCQQLGDEWLRKNQSPVTKVPSAIIPQEHNFLLNPYHPDFSKIHLLRVEPFVFDSRIKQ